MHSPLIKHANKFRNKRGGTLFETLLMSGLGIVLVLGQSVLKSSRAWGWATYENQKSCLPGNAGCPIVLWYNPRNPPSKGNGTNDYNNPATVRVWACNLINGGAIAYADRSGTILALGNSSNVCGSCANANDDLHCHLKRLKKDPKNFIRIKIKPLTNYNASIEMVPPFKFDIEDYNFTKQKLSFDSVSEQTVFTPTRNRCPNGSLMTGYNDDRGTPICKYPLTGGYCTGSSVVVGVNPDGSPRCGIPGTSNVSNSIAGGSCPSGSVVTKINNSGVPGCVIAAKTGTCPAGTLATGFDAKGILLCGPYGGSVTPPVTPPPTPPPTPKCTVTPNFRITETGDFTTLGGVKSTGAYIKGLFSPQVKWDSCRAQDPNCRLSGTYTCKYHFECEFTVKVVAKRWTVGNKGYLTCEADPFIVGKTFSTTDHSTPYNTTDTVRDSKPLEHKCPMPPNPNPDKWRICKNGMMEKDLYNYYKSEYKRIYGSSIVPQMDFNCIDFKITNIWHNSSRYSMGCPHKDSRPCTELNRCDP
jgi:hypothetical protein